MRSEAGCLNDMRDARPVEVRVASTLPGWPEARVAWAARESSSDTQPADLIEELISSGASCDSTPFVSDEPGYFVELRAGDDVCSCFIGLDSATVALLERWATTLDGERRVAIESLAGDIGERLAPAANSAVDRRAEGPQR